MADKTIAELSAQTTVQDTDLLVIQRGTSPLAKIQASVLGQYIAGLVSGVLIAANNLSDLTNVGIARTNLGLGTAALQASTAFAQAANNLSDLASAATARGNLGLGTAATAAASSFAQVANNLSDLASAPTARGNLGLGGAATLNVGTGAGTVAAGDDARITGALNKAAGGTVAGTTNYTGGLAINGVAAGYLGAPQDQQNANYTLVAADAGGMLYHTSATAHAYTIPPNSAVAFDIGTVILIENEVGGGVVTLTRGAGVTLYWRGVSATSADRSLAANSACSIKKVATDTWVVVGVGLT